MSAEQETHLRQLLELANGDLDLLDDALTKAAPEKTEPSLEDIVEYILTHLSEHQEEVA